MHAVRTVILARHETKLFVCWKYLALQIVREAKEVLIVGIKLWHATLKLERIRREMMAVFAAKMPARLKALLFFIWDVSQ